MSIASASDTPASPVIPLTEAQCREALIRLQQYAQWMYHTPAGLATFAKNSTVEHAGRRFTFTIRPDGRIVATLLDNGAKALFDVMTTTGPLRTETTLDNVDYRARVANSDELSAADALFAREILILALSLFQRTQAFQFFSRMEPVTLNGIARDLSLAT